METKLFDLIQEHRDVIDSYLGNVTPEDFINDVKALMTLNVNKAVIVEAIAKLQLLIDDDKVNN